MAEGAPSGLAGATPLQPPAGWRGSRVKKQEDAPREERSEFHCLGLWLLELGDRIWGLSVPE